jgi:hypothetical protein
MTGSGEMCSLTMNKEVKMFGWFALLLIVAGLVYGAWRLGFSFGKESAIVAKVISQTEGPSKVTRLVVFGGLDDLDVDTVEYGDSFDNRLPYCEIFACNAVEEARQRSHDREGQYLMKLCQKKNIELRGKNLKIVPTFYYDNGYVAPSPVDGDFQLIHKITWSVRYAGNYGG